MANTTDDLDKLAAQALDGIEATSGLKGKPGFSSALAWAFKAGQEYERKVREMRVRKGAKRFTDGCNRRTERRRIETAYQENEFATTGGSRDDA
jgi:hypothetical protein